MTTFPEKGGSSEQDPPFSSSSDPAPPPAIEYRSEIVRKSIHFTSLLIPIIYSVVTKDLAIMLLAPLVSLALAVELGKQYSPSFARLYYRIFGKILRVHEHDRTAVRFNGATYVLLSAIICVVVFPKLITITAFAILIISDSTAALIGRKFGKKQFFRKSRIGAVAFFMSAVIVVLVTPKSAGLPAEYAIGIVGAFAGTIVESASRIDDNLAIPISVGALMWGLYAIFLPSLDLAGPTPLF